MMTNGARIRAGKFRDDKKGIRLRFGIPVSLPSEAALNYPGNNISC